MFIYCLYITISTVHLFIIQDLCLSPQVQHLDHIEIMHFLGYPLTPTVFRAVVKEMLCVYIIQLYYI
jgi:hypothetical protein